MGRIVRDHYPVNRLPEDLRHGLASDSEVRITIEPAKVTKDIASTPSGHFTRFRHLTRENLASADEVDLHVAALRAEWDR